MTNRNPNGNSSDRLDRIEVVLERITNRLVQVSEVGQRTDDRLDRLSAGQQQTDERLDRLSEGLQQTDVRLERIAAAVQDERIQRAEDYNELRNAIATRQRKTCGSITCWRMPAPIARRCVGSKRLISVTTKNFEP